MIIIIIIIITIIIIINATAFKMGKFIKDVRN